MNPPERRGPETSATEESLRSRLALPVGMIVVGAAMAGGSGLATYEGIKHHNQDLENAGVGTGLISLGAGMAGVGIKGVWDELRTKSDRREEPDNFTD